MTGRPRFVLSTAAVLCLALPFLGSVTGSGAPRTSHLASRTPRAARRTPHAARRTLPQAAAFKDGQSFYVVAVRAFADTAAFRVCQPGVQETREFPGLELVRTGEPGTPQADPAIRDRIEAEFRKQQRYRVAATPDRAVYVFFAQGTFVPVTSLEIGRGPDEDADARLRSSRSNTRPAPGRAYVQAGTDYDPDAMTSVLAIVVPARAYAGGAAKVQALLDAKLWEAAHFDSNLRAASPEDLVRQLHAPPGRPEARPVPAGDPERDPPQAREVAERERLRMSRLNGRSICAMPQPGRAPAMAPELARVPDVQPDAAPAIAPPPVRRPDTPVATFQARVVAVAVPVVASTRQGTPVGGLTLTDFTVFEDNIPQRIDRMVAESEPFTAALVIDTSFSTLPRVTELTAAASAFIDTLRARDRSLTVTFDSRTWLMCDVTGDERALRRAIGRLQPSGALSRLHDTLDVVAGERLEKIAGRKALVVLTDGMDVGSRWAGAAGVMARLEAASVPVYAVQFDSRKIVSRRPRAVERQQGTPDGYFDRIISFDHATEYLKQLAQNTGGLFEPASTAGAIVQAFRRAADDVRSQYVLYYYPSNQAQDGRFRRIRVEVSRPGVTARARAGYRAPSNPR